MERSKCIDILKSFSEEEIKLFKDFLSSPFFNTHKIHIKLLDILKKYHPEYPHDKIEKEKVFKKLYPGKVFNEQVMKNLISEFMRLQKEFLGQLQYKTHDNERALNTIKMLNTKNLKSLYHSESKKYKQDLEVMLGMDNSYFYHLFGMAQEEKGYFLARNMQQEVPSLVLKGGEHLIYHFLQQFTNVILELNINEDVYNAVFDINLPAYFLKNLDLEKILEYMEKNNFENAQHIAVDYYSVMAYIHYDNDDYYYKLKKYIMQDIDKQSVNVRAKYFNLQEQVLIKKTNHMQEHMYKELFDVHKIIAENEFYSYKSGHLPVTTCRNIIVTAINVGEIDWAFKFLDTHINNVPEEFRQNIYNLLSAHLHFFSGNFEKSLEILPTIKYDQHAVKVDVKIFTLKIYYELSYYESAVSLIDSFRHFIVSDKYLTESRRLRYLNFLSATSSLIKTKTSPEKESIEKLKTKFNDAEFVVTSKPWLLKKLSEIENGGSVKAI